MPAAVEIPSWWEMPWRAWHQLTTTRSYSVSGFAAPLGGMQIRSQPSPIPWPAIQEWCDRHDLDDSEREFVAHVVHDVDADYLAWWRTKNEG